MHVDNQQILTDYSYNSDSFKTIMHSLNPQKREWPIMMSYYEGEGYVSYKTHHNKYRKTATINN